jgi:NAD+ synthase (glutamine-hydrolysing)
MKIILAQINVHVGNFEQNFQKIQEEISLAKIAQVDLIIFPELAICGYPPRDFLDYVYFIEQVDLYISRIAKICTGITCIIGAPIYNEASFGKKLFNAAYVLANGTIQSVVHKSLLPTYDVFDEYRYFEPAKSVSCVEVSGKKIALTICEDLWNAAENPLYDHTPMDLLMQEQPELMINIAASPFDYLQEDKRKQMLKANCLKYNLPLIYVNHVGAQTEIIFDGGSMVMSAKGELLQEAKYFQEECLLIEDFDILISDNKIINPSNYIAVQKIEKALLLGIQDYFSKSGFSKAVLGLSGGIDSAVVCALATKALGPKNVLAVLLPSAYSSDHSIADAMALVENLGIEHTQINIEATVKSAENTLAELFQGTQADITEENLQARVRGLLLMAISNKFGHILLNTSNKSEAAVGYGTLYGDMSGGISVIGDVYKTKVFELAKWINRSIEIIPWNTIQKAPSAELRHNQKDSDSLPDYDLLDQVLHLYIEEQLGLAEIIAKGYDEILVKRVLMLVNRSEYKRYQTPPTLRISPKAFGMGRRMPIVAKY